MRFHCPAFTLRFSRASRMKQHLYNIDASPLNN